MKAALMIILLALAGCANYHEACEQSDRKPGGEGFCQHSETGAHFSPAIDPSIRF
jgi:hypothetical protein